MGKLTDTCRFFSALLFYVLVVVLCNRDNFINKNIPNKTKNVMGKGANGVYAIIYIVCTLFVSISKNSSS